MRSVGRWLGGAGWAVLGCLAGACADDAGDDDVRWDVGADADADGPVDVAADADTDADPGDGTAAGPEMLYDGPRDDRAVVSGWSADDPRPLIVFAKYDASDVWYVSMAEVSAAGVVGGMVTERVRFWGWAAGSPEAPSLLYEGALDSGARIPGWNAAEPFPVIVLTRYASQDTWFVSMSSIDETGCVSGPVTDEVKVWGWGSSTAPGAPGLVYEGPRDASAIVPGWSVAAPRPLVVLTKNAAETAWWLTMAEVSPAGVVGGMITDRLRVWAW